MCAKKILALKPGCENNKSMVDRVDNSIRSAVELDEVAELPNYIQVL